LVTTVTESVFIIDVLLFKKETMDGIKHVHHTENG